MSEAIIVALITGGLSLAGVIATCTVTANKQEKSQAVAQAITDTKVEALTREVRQYNGFSQKIPLLEARCDGLQSRCDGLEQKVGRLEQYHMQQN